MTQHNVTVEVANRKLKIACPAGQESALLSAAKEVTERLTQSTKKPQSTNTPEQAMLMVALNLANDLLKTKAQLRSEREENLNQIQLLQSTIEQAITPQKNKQA